jgi:hypothetical protein
MGMNTDIIKSLTGKRIKSDMEPYYAGVNLYEQWKKINEHLHLTQSNGNGKITSIQELTDLMAEALSNILKPEIEKILRKNPTLKDTLKVGVPLKPHAMSPREILEQYIKLVKRED